MSFVLYVPVKESLKELRRLLKNSNLIMQPRFKMLLAMKKAGEQGISKQALMDTVGVCSQIIHNWRTACK